MKKINGFNGRAKKIKGDGYLEYELWVNEVGDFFVRILNNDVDTNSPGTHSKYFIPIKKYAKSRYSKNPISNITSLDLQGKEKELTNSNNGAFLKAVLCNLLPER